jgi:hypothetical protein
MRASLTVVAAALLAAASGCATGPFTAQTIDVRGSSAAEKPLAPPCVPGRCTVKLEPKPYNCDWVAIDPYVLDARRLGNAVRVEVELPAGFRFFDDTARPPIFVKQGFDRGLIVGGPRVEDLADKGDARKATFVLRNPAGGLNAYGVRFGRGWDSSAKCEADPWIVD